jgi:hypothetical protein
MNERNAIKQVKSRDEKIAYNRAWYQCKKAERDMQKIIQMR